MWWCRVTHSSTGIRKDDDKWEYAYFYFFVFQLIVLGLIASPHSPIGCAFVVVASLFIGLMRVSANGITSQRYMVGATAVALLFLLLFCVHLTDKFGRGKSTSSVVLCVELIIPEVLLVRSSHT